MDSARLAELLQPFIAVERLDTGLIQDLQLYLELLQRWNARVNLTAIRDPAQIVVRHFGESLFTARVFMHDQQLATAPDTLIDVGSGAGFPGIPIKLVTPLLHLTLIESQGKKAAFLRELQRTLSLDRVEVFCGRAEQWKVSADVVTLRAVERFDRVLPVAGNLVKPGGTLGLLIGTGQLAGARALISDGWTWSDPLASPCSRDRVLALATKQ